MITLKKLISWLESYRSEYKILPEDLIEAISSYNPKISESNQNGIAVKYFISNLKEMFVEDAEFELKELIYEIQQLDFNSEKFERFGNAHGLCDCSKCKSIERILHADY